MDLAKQTFVQDCTISCASIQSAAGISSFCDESCSGGWSLSSVGPWFGGHGSGAGDASKHGTNCRLCYTNQQDTLEADRNLETLRSTFVSSAAHVDMCATRMPPPSPECSAACQLSDNTVRFLLMLPTTTTPFLLHCYYYFTSRVLFGFALPVAGSPSIL